MADMGILLDSLGWALLHSLWQVGLIGLVVFASLRLIRRDQPGLRYAVAYSGMAVSLVAFVATFVAGLQTGPAAGPLIAAPETGLVAMLGRTTGFISLAWVGGFALLSLRYAAMIRATHRLRAEGLSDVPSLWQQRLAVWAERLGAGSVRIFESALVDTPLTLGMFKPLVLVPAGFFLRLPRDQAEAILVHELAHICRQDYLFGLIQAFIVNVFFFHPAIHWLSRQVDLEREHACDARAALETGDKAALARGLSRVAIDMHDRRIGFAMAARGPHSVVERIRRLGELRGRKNPDDRSPAVALGMLFGAGIIFAVAVDSGGSEREEQLARASVLPEAPAIPAPSVASAPEAAVEAHERRAETDTAARAVEHSPRGAVHKKAKSGARERADEAVREAHAESPDERLFAVSLAGGGWGASPVTGLFRQAVYEVQRSSPFLRAAMREQSGWDEADDEDCDEEERRAEAIAERAEARAEAWAEAHADRVEAQAERAAERAIARAERDAERFADDEERRAEAFEARMEALADRAEWLAEQKEEREERERDRRDWERERREGQREFENEAGRPVVTISFVVPAAPAALPAPVRPVAVSFEIAG